ncbi:MAG: glycosyltransferase family 4 protein [Vicinamibacterales bacterium]
MTRRLLLLTLYYPPDLSAGSFRASALVTALTAADPDLEIDVVTSVPNRYQTYSAEAPAVEQHGRVTVRRLPMPGHRSDMTGQAMAYARFARHAAGATAGRSYDLVCATSSRLMTATLGAWVARRTGAPLFLDVRDLFVDTMADLLRPPVSTVLSPLLSGVERWTMRRATHINLVSRGFAGYMKKRYPRIPLSFVTNGIDDEFLEEPVVVREPAPDRPVTVVYAGNMGEGQGLHAIIPGLASALGQRAHFKLIGDGGRRVALTSALTNAGVTNVEVLPPIPRARLIEQYREADVLFLHLNAQEAFTRVLPSKIFEYAAMGAPILAGVDGYAAEFLRTEVSNAAVFPPCDVAAGLAAWETLDLRTQPRVAFVEAYGRRALMRTLASHVLECLPARGAS